MTTTEFEPIDLANAARVDSEPRDRRKASAAFDLRHPSGQPAFADWCEVAMPWQIAKDRGFIDGKQASWVDADTGKETPAVLRTVRGRQSVFFDVLAEFHAGGHATGDIMERSKHGFASEFALHPNLRDGVLRLPSINGVEPSANSYRVLAQTDALLRTIATYDLGEGVFAYAESFVRSMDPVVTVNITLRRRALDGSGGVKIARMVFGPGAVAAEPMLPDNSVHMVRWHALDWGTSPTRTFQVYYAGHARDPITAQSEANARFGEPVGMFRYWGTGNARWFAMGVAPRGSFNHADIVAGALRDRDVSYNARRPMSQQLNAGQGGAQRFGQSLAGWIFSPNPKAATLLRLAAEDELLRPVHWIDEQGRSLRAVDRPDYKLVDREPHSGHTRGWVDEFGAYPPSTTPAGGRTTDDVLHIDDVALAAYLALRDDCWAIEDCYRQIVEREAAATRLQAGWFTRARGFGRCLKSMADAAWLFLGDDTGTTAVAAISARLHIALGAWKGREVTDPTLPIRPIDYQRDPRLLGGRHNGVIPYEEASCVAGLVAASHVLSGEHRTAALGMAYHCANTIHALACVHPDTGPWFAYGVGIPTGADMGKLPPEGFEAPGTAEHADWVHGTRDSGWTRWSIAASYLLPYICDALTEIVGAEITSPYLDVAESIVSASIADQEWLGNPDELHRFSACAQTLEDAAYVDLAPVEGGGR